MDTEQAPAASDLNELGSFLDDNEGADASTDDDEGSAPHDDAKPAPKGDKRAATPKAPPADDEDESDDPDGEPADGEDDAEDSDDDAEQTSEQVTIKVPVVGADGKKTIKEVSPDELSSMVMMRDDYTRKTQELARERAQVTEAATQRTTQALQQYQQQAQFAMDAVQRLAGLKSDQEMYALSVQNPSEFIQEKARQDYVRGVLNNMGHAVQQQTAQQQAEVTRQEQEARQRAFSACWGALGHDGLDGPKVAAIFDVMTKDYGVEPERFENISDPKLIRIMRDAAAYRALQGKATRVTDKARSAPTLPTQRAQPPKTSKVVQGLNQKFTSGRANQHDLGAYLDATERQTSRRR